LALFLPGLAELADASFGDFVLLNHFNVLPDDAPCNAREEGDLGETLPVLVELINTFEVGEIGIDCVWSVVDAARDFLSQQSLQFQFDRLAFIHTFAFSTARRRSWACWNGFTERSRRRKCTGGSTMTRHIAASVWKNSVVVTMVAGLTGRTSAIATLSG